MLRTLVNESQEKLKYKKEISEHVDQFSNIVQKELLNLTQKQNPQVNYFLNQRQTAISTVEYQLDQFISLNQNNNNAGLVFVYWMINEFFRFSTPIRLFVKKLFHF